MRRVPARLLPRVALLLVALLLAGCSLMGSGAGTPRPTSGDAQATTTTVKLPAGWSGVTILVEALPPEAIDTLLLIEAGGPFPYFQDDGTFQNREGRLPDQRRGYYREYTVETPGSPDRGARRIVVGADGERYYTDDHYELFRFIVGDPGILTMRMRLDPGVSRLRTRSSTEEVTARLTRAGWDVRVVDVAEAKDKAGLLDAFARALSFPTWVGRNWDALDDALRDLSWWAAGERGRAIIVARAGRMDGSLEREWATLCDVLTTAADRWRDTPTPLGVLVRGRALG